PHDEARAIYHGKPAEVSCRLALFRFANIDVEFLEPGPDKSVWRDVLEEKGPGVHHIAFKTRNMTERGRYLESKGHAELQKAEFLGAHGRYAYYDTVKDLGIQLELLEFNADMEPQAESS
ncbi:MAG: VOC family protein, partial [Devosia sp.]